MMMILHMNIKNSENLVMIIRKRKNKQKFIFQKTLQALLERLISFIYCENPSSQNLAWTLEYVLLNFQV